MWEAAEEPKELQTNTFTDNKATYYGNDIGTLAHSATLIELT